ncbi:hypothetical protein Poli38472_011988 [Pythium oligandrum]|uniref:Purple acid phosphatase n=1 Tax=Pythium oligandrum TaxID=41045 RepID=A0A8K1FPF8_PYTOL|nr:hypothetical protein Poli38472_011988 [Pythium oligandrum]|eukprot:TMW66872.1 hypothetical protein Poli38472_011988 [Pythium oligandrum]
MRTTLLLLLALPLVAGHKKPQHEHHLRIQVQSRDMRFPEGVDDHTCEFSWDTMTCVPDAYCSYQYKFGDLTFDQSCRLVPESVGRVPQHLHLAYAGEDAGTGMSVSWTTYAEVDDPAVWIGTSKDALELVDADIEVATYYESDDYHLYNYHVIAQDLKPATQYFYRVGSQSESAHQSEVFHFTTARSADETKPFSVAFYGDFGVDANADATMQYVNDNLPVLVDFVFHIGDISYADNAFTKATEFFGFFYEETYNRWMATLSRVMTSVPYMVLVGNHEAECHSPACAISSSKKDQLGNYTAFNTRFRMPSEESGGVENMWYSFEHGPVHYTAISSETDFPSPPSNSYVGRTYGGFGNQLAWLEADLKKAHENRKNVPWLIVGMHRSMYTRDHADDIGEPIDHAATLQAAFEDLFIKYEVDVVVSGHVHWYERQFPIKKNEAVMDGVSEDGNTYTNPKAPVYLVTGAAGNTEGHEASPRNEIEWNAVLDNENYGISILNVTRKTLSWSFIATETGEVLDEFSIVKDEA